MQLQTKNILTSDINQVLHQRANNFRGGRVVVDQNQQQKLSAEGRSNYLSKDCRINNSLKCYSCS